ncbi:MAG: hypothetical protein JSU98_02930 [Gemmatimonadales bacterium]|nr:MAG: hypothetical protein JSU98_02930 [Gemmatimonadales bacterium]
MRRITRRAWAGPLSGLLLMSGVAGPLLETVRPADGPVWESHHAPGDCGRGHDHSLCTVLEGSTVLPAPGPESHAAHAAHRAQIPDPDSPAYLVTLSEGHPPRAPPVG